MSSVEFTDNSDEVKAAMRSAVLHGRHNSVSGTFPRGIRRCFRDCPHTVEGWHAGKIHPSAPS